MSSIVPHIPNETNDRSDRLMPASWVVSCVVHLGLIALIASLTMRSISESLPEMDLASLAESEEVPEWDEIAVDEPLKIEHQAKSAGGSLGGSPVATEVIPHTPGEYAPSSVILTPAFSTDVALNEVVSTQAAASAGEPGNASGAGEGNGVGDGKGSGFFGVNVLAQSAVFVVDCSSSMNTPHESDAKTRFRRLKFELLKAIGTMGATQQFYIVYFNDQAVPMPASGLQYATPDAQQHFLRWMAKVPAVGETDPREALRVALKLNPQVIYFLTDGSFEYKIDQELMQFRQRRIQIHTFAFGSKEGETVMKAVASNNQGEYHFVP